MVLVKAILGQETRKFPLQSDATFQDLGSKLLEVFPSLKARSVTDLELLYRDSDGDFITVSSDEELQTALQHSTEDTIKFVVRVKATSSDAEDEDSCGLEDLVDSLFHHRPLFHTLPLEHSIFGNHFPFGFRSDWHERRRQLKRQEEKLRQQRLYEEKMRRARLEHLKAMREKARKEQEEKSAAESSRDTSKEVQQKEQPLVPEFPVGWNVTPFGTWSPVVHHGPGYTVHSWGPWGYKAVFNGTSDNTKEKESDKPADKPVTGDEPESKVAEAKEESQ